MMNMTEVAAVLGISRAGAYKLAHNADFPAFQIGKRIVVSREKFLDWLDRQCEEQKCAYEETISFYHRIGFETYDTEINGASRVCFLRLNDLILEVYECSACTQQTGAWDHIAINVCDIDAAFEYVTSEMPLQPTCVQKLPFFERGVRFFVITGPNGERVEFNQYL